MPIAYFFLAGLIGGISLALLVCAGKLYRYRKQVLINQRQNERLERHNSDLQLQLHEQARQLKQVLRAKDRTDKLRGVA